MTEVLQNVQVFARRRRRCRRRQSYDNTSSFSSKTVELKPGERVDNTVDYDEMPCSVASDLGQHCLLLPVHPNTKGYCDYCAFDT